MDNAFVSALGRISADEELIRKTKDYILSHYSAERNTARSAAPRRNAMIRRLAAAACAVLLLVGCPIGAYAYYKTPTSYLSIDINPSVELGINAFGKVVTVNAYNADGETILDGQNVVNMDVKEAVSLLITSASQHGFILEDGSTIISIISETNNEENAEELTDKAEEGAEAAMDSEGNSAAIQKDNISLERRDEARELGISPGKLNLIQKLQELDPTITVEEYQDLSVTEIQKKFTELKKEQNGKPEKEDSAQTEASPETETSPSMTPDGETPSGNGNGHSSNNGSDTNSGGKQDDNDKPNGNNGNGQNTSAGNYNGSEDSQTGDGDSDGEEDKPGNGNNGSNGNGNNSNGNNSNGNNDHTGLSEDESSDKPDNGNQNKPDDDSSSNGTGNGNGNYGSNNENNGNNGRNSD